MKSLRLFLSLFFTGLPFFYLANVYGSLPDTVPIHFDLFGNPDGFGPKWILWLLPGLMIPLILVVTARWRKDTRPDGSPSKLAQLGLITLGTVSVLFTYLIYVTQQGGSNGLNGIAVILGVIFALQGNYFPVLPRNKFVGFRIPKTLKSDRVWRETHRAIAPYFVGGGILLVVIGILAPATVSGPAMIVLTLLILIVSFVIVYRIPPEQPSDLV